MISIAYHYNYDNLRSLQRDISLAGVREERAQHMHGIGPPRGEHAAWGASKRGLTREEQAREGGWRVPGQHMGDKVVEGARSAQA